MMVTSATSRQILPTIPKVSSAVAAIEANLWTDTKTEHVDFSAIPNRKYAETCLRSQIRAKIARLPAVEQDAAIQAEKERQEDWQREMDALEQAQMINAQQQALPNPPVMGVAVPQPPSLPAKRKSFWLKFKRQKGQKAVTTRT